MMSLKSTKGVLIGIGLVLFALGCIAWGIGPVVTSVQHGPHGVQVASVLDLSGWGLPLMVIGFLTALLGVLKGHVPKWVA